LDGKFFDDEFSGHRRKGHPFMVRSYLVPTVLTGAFSDIWRAGLTAANIVQYRHCHGLDRAKEDT
jgi:hypothetical protein